MEGKSAATLARIAASSAGWDPISRSSKKASTAGQVSSLMFSTSEMSLRPHGMDLMACKKLPSQMSNPHVLSKSLFYCRSSALSAPDCRDRRACQERDEGREIPVRQDRNQAPVNNRMWGQCRSDHEARKHDRGIKESEGI